VKLPCDISSKEFIKSLQKLGYNVTRQKGSHIRLTALNNGKQHHLTIPAHDPLKIGTLSAILSDIAQQFAIPKEEVIKKLFG